KPAPPAAPVRQTAKSSACSIGARFVTHSDWPATVSVDTRCLPAVSADGTQVAVAFTETHDHDALLFSVSFLNRAGKGTRNILIRDKMGDGRGKKQTGGNSMGRQVAEANALLAAGGFHRIGPVPIPESYRPFREEGKLSEHQLKMQAGDVT